MNFLKKIINKAAKIEANEIRAVLLSFAFVFSCLASYYIIRSVRDGMSSDWSDAELSTCLLYTSPSPRDGLLSRMPSSA